MPAPPSRIPKAIRESMKLLGLSPRPKPPLLPELGAVPIFHPFCFNPSTHPCPGLEIPSVLLGPDHFMVQARTAAPTAPRPAGVSHHATCCLGYLQKQPPREHSCSLFFGCSPKDEAEGHKPPLMALVLLCTHPGVPRGNPALAEEWGQLRSTKDKRRAQRVAGCPPAPLRPPAPSKAAKNSARRGHNGGPVWPWWH